MEERNMELRKGLEQLYNSQFLSVVAVVLMFIPVVNIVALIMALVAAVMALLAVLKLQNLHHEYEVAARFLIGGMVIAILGAGFKGGAKEVLDIFRSIVSFGQTYYIIRGTCSLLTEQGDLELVEKGNQAIRLYVATLAIGVIVSALGLLLGANSAGLVLILAIIPLIVSIAGFVVYIKFLGAAKDAF